MVAEARDIVESPQFRAVAAARGTAAVERAAETLVPQGQPTKLGKLVGPMKAACEAALAAEDNAEVAACSAAPEVAELSELLFFDETQQ